MSKPQISLNKLAEYLDANPTRRKRIVKDAKDPQPFIVTRYNEARNGIIEYINSGCDVQKIEDVISSLKDKIQNLNFKNRILRSQLNYSNLS